MRILYYRMFGLLIVFILAFTANHLLINGKKSCKEQDERPLYSATPQEAQPSAQPSEQLPTQGVVLLEGPKRIEKISAGQYPQSLKAEDLYRASLHAIKVILASQSSFFNAHQKYAANLAELNLELLPESGETSLPSSIQSSFNIIVTAAYAEVVHYSFPISSEENYTLRFYYNGQVSCIAKEAQAGNTCQTLSSQPASNGNICLAGGNCPSMKGQQTPVIRYVGADYTEYTLPNDFLSRYN